MPAFMPNSGQSAEFGYTNIFHKYSFCSDDIPVKTICNSMHITHKEL